jgi:3'(2'), 5'-bisphosphate nucleotidase
MHDLKKLVSRAIAAAESACSEILTVYNSADLQVELKGDSSPLTLADKKAHHAIENILKSTGLPMLSEEGKNISYDVRKHWDLFWLVDPLDGTKEFIKRNGEFTVNIALIENQKPVLGVVAVPVTGELYYSTKGGGAYLKKDNDEKFLPKRSPVDLTVSALKIVASRSHMNEETQQFVNTLKNPELISAGSSLKFILLASGRADVYPRFAPTMEWDTAAGHAIVNETGLNVLEHGSNDELRYNKDNLLNPHFLCR